MSKLDPALLTQETSVAASSLAPCGCARWTAWRKPFQFIGRLLVNTIALVCMLPCNRQLAGYGVRGTRKWVVVVCLSLIPLVFTPEIAGSNVGQKLSILALVTTAVFLVLLSTRLRVFCLGGCVLLILGTRRAALHLLRPMSKQDTRGLSAELRTALAEAVNFGVEHIEATSPLLAKDSHRRRLERILQAELGCNAAVYSVKVTEKVPSPMGRLTSGFYRLFYADTLPAELRPNEPEAHGPCTIKHFLVQHLRLLTAYGVAASITHRR